MNELVQAVVKLIEDGLNLQETVVCCFTLVTAGFSLWVIITGIVNISKITITTIDNIFTSILKGVKSVFGSLANVSSHNQPPKC